MNTRLMFFVLILAVLLPSGQALASDARTDALAVQREYLEDYILFRAYPTVAARYQNLVTASLGNRQEGDRSVGVIGAGENSNYGVFALYLNDLGNNAAQDAQIDLTWAKQFTSMALGASFSWTSSSTETGDSKRSPLSGAGTNNLSFTGGVKLDVGETDMIEAALELASLTFEEPGGRMDDGQLSYRASVRMMKELNERTTLVPLVQYQKVNLTAKGDPDDTSGQTFNFGMAIHHKVNGNDLLIMGASANYFKSLNYQGGSESVELSSWDMPALFVALEFGVYDWLTTRVGATKTVEIRTDNPAGDSVPDTDRTASQYIFGLGMGLHFDHFDVDATVNPSSIFTGGYLFSGESSQPLGRVTGTYYF